MKLTDTATVVQILRLPQFLTVSIAYYVIPYAVPCVFQKICTTNQFLFWIDPVLPALTNALVGKR